MCPQLDPSTGSTARRRRSTNVAVNTLLSDDEDDDSPLKSRRSVFSADKLSSDESDDGDVSPTETRQKPSMRFQRGLVKLVGRMETLKPDESRKWLEEKTKDGLITTLCEVVEASLPAKTHVAALICLRLYLNFLPDIPKEVTHDFASVVSFVHDAILRHESDVSQHSEVIYHYRAYEGFLLVDTYFQALQNSDEARFPDNRKAMPAAMTFYSNCLSFAFFMLGISKMPADKRLQCSEMLFRAYLGRFRERVMELCHTHANRMQFGEVCVAHANDTKGEFKETAIQILFEVLNAEKSDFLYRSEIDILADVLLREASEHDMGATRCLQAYKKCFSHRNYKLDEMSRRLGDIEQYFKETTTTEVITID